MGKIPAKSPLRCQFCPPCRSCPFCYRTTQHLSCLLQWHHHLRGFMGSLGQTVIRHPLQTCIYRDPILCILDCHVLLNHALSDLQPALLAQHCSLPLPMPSTSLLLVVDNIPTEHCFLVYPLYYCDYQVAVFVPLVPSHLRGISADSQSTLSCLVYYRHFEIH
jgi:hypothetical protein